MPEELKLKIKYQDDLDEQLDKEIKKLLKKHDWKFEGSGFDYQNKTRDLAFYKPKD